jgi:monofunctional glycosyltransferase
VRRILALVVIVALVTAAYTAFVIGGLPARSAVRALARSNPQKTGVMRQREAEARAAGRKPRSEQLWVPLVQISRHLIQGVIVAEDARFFGHGGVDWDAMKDALERDVREHRLALGGSTITQQLAKNLFFTTQKSVTRKLRELVVTRWLEADLSKRRILELYLNVIEWGDGVYGCEAAARRYYGKPAAELSAEEAAGLVAMIPSPRRINPRVNPAVHARATRRVLWLMSRADYAKKAVGGLGVEPPPESVDESGPEPVEPE